MYENYSNDSSLSEQLRQEMLKLEQLNINLQKEKYMNQMLGKFDTQSQQSSMTSEMKTSGVISQQMNHIRKKISHKFKKRYDPDHNIIKFDNNWQFIDPNNKQTINIPSIYPQQLQFHQTKKPNFYQYLPRYNIHKQNDSHQMNQWKIQYNKNRLIQDKQFEQQRKQIRKQLLKQLQFDQNNEFFIRKPTYLQKNQFYETKISRYCQNKTLGKYLHVLQRDRNKCSNIQRKIRVMSSQQRYKHW